MSSVVFVSYSRQDKDLKDQLVEQLEVLEPEGLIKIWVDDRLSAGEEYQRAIEEAILQADVAILLITSSFLTSRFILHDEVPLLLKRKQNANLDLFPVIARPCGWEEVGWLSKIEVRPKGGKPVWGKGDFVAERYLAGIVREVAARARAGAAERPSGKLASETLDAEFRTSLASVDPAESPRVQDMIRQTISHGAKMYDQGDVDGCVDIYRLTAQRLLTRVLSSMPKMAGSGMKMMGGGVDTAVAWRMMTSESMGMGRDPTPRHELNKPLNILNAARFDLRETLQRADALSSPDLDGTAWDLRFCLDRIWLLFKAYDDTAALVAGASYRTAVSGSPDLRPAIDVVRSAISMASSSGFPMIDPDDRSTMVCGALALDAARLLLDTLGAESGLGPGQSPEEALYLRVREAVERYPEIAPENSHEVTWNLVRTFDLYSRPSSFQATWQYLFAP